ncbi:MAG: hypothetical protein AAFR81_27975 [Chloroflexota bacterium]
MKTIFRRPDSHNLRCDVWGFTPSHGPALRIRIHRGAGTLYWLDFIGLEYFSGPTTWKGAHIFEAPKDRFNSLVNELGISSENIERMQPALYHIPAIKGNNISATTTVEILAINHVMTKGDV